jgi:hypothetical protein
MNLRRLLIDVILVLTIGAGAASARTGGAWIVDGEPGTKPVVQADVQAGDAGVSNALVAAQVSGDAGVSNALVQALQVGDAGVSNAVVAAYRAGDIGVSNALVDAFRIGDAAVSNALVSICRGGDASLSNAVWAFFQPANSNLSDLADGMLSKSKVEDSGHWDSAYGWGNHATNGYMTNYHGSVGFAWGADTGSVGNVFYSGRFDDPCTLTNLAAVIRNGGSARIDLRYHPDWGLTNCTVVYTGLVVGGAVTNLAFNQTLSVGSGLSIAATNGAWTNMSVSASYSGKNL